MADEVTKSWRSLLMRLALAREYPLFAALDSLPQLADLRNPVLDSVLPGTFLVNACSVLDVALKEVLAARAARPRTFGLKDDLFGRIECAQRVGVLREVESLHSARSARNDVSHELAAPVTWQELQVHTTAIGAALLELGFQVTTPALEVHAERIPLESVEEPYASFGFLCRVTVGEAGRVWGKVEWRSLVADE